MRVCIFQVYCAIPYLSQELYGGLPPNLIRIRTIFTFGLCQSFTSIAAQVVTLSNRQGTPLSKHLFISIHLPLASLQVFGSFADSWHHLPHHHLRVIQAPEFSGHRNISASVLCLSGFRSVTFWFPSCDMGIKNPSRSSILRSSRTLHSHRVFVLVCQCLLKGCAVRVCL